MFPPIVFRPAPPTRYLANGSRLIWTSDPTPNTPPPEARDPREALAQDLAGEHVMRNLALKPSAKRRESYGAHATIHVFKNNVDSPATPSAATKTTWSAASCVGDHRTQLLPFLITRQLYTGAGRMTPDGFQLTQRADFLDEAVSRPPPAPARWFNTRDEPHADPDSFRRCM